ncbi:MAG: glycosyltransferase family 39 protein [Candidatus Omnitrophica bacterium]|nr:glycosyltransferase family 39 protein [Candidatus Omnitrophota bacterium]
MNRLKTIVILSIIVVFGFVLRVYNLDFPTIGYHNMKENEYLSMAQEMLKTYDFISRRIYFYNAFEPEPKMRLYPQIPLISYQIFLAWKLLGDNLWSARLFNVIFGILSIIMIYLIGTILFKGKKAAFLSAILMAVLPLAVFFSRNLQPESPAFFFMLLGNFLYLKYTTSLNSRYLFWGGVAFSLAWLYKFSFLFGVLPFIFCFPFRSILKERKQFFKTLYVPMFSYLIIPLTIFYLKYIGQWEFQELDRIKFFDIFHIDYWIKYGKMIRWYLVGENFGLVFLGLTILGILVAFNKKKKLAERYILGWTFTVIPYSMVFSDYINQHNYYQMPFLGLVCIAVAYVVNSVSETIKKFLKYDFFIYISFGIMLLATPFIKDSLMRMFGTIFLGQDVAGESLKEFTYDNERIFLLTHHQGWAIARYAQRYMGWIDDAGEFKEIEEKWKIRYICIYPAEFIHLLEKNNPILFDYIKNNYHFKEIGLTREPEQIYYLILEKGIPVDPDNFLRNFSGKLTLRNTYRIFSRYIFFYTLRRSES